MVKIYLELLCVAVFASKMPCYHPITAYRTIAPDHAGKHNIAFKPHTDSVELQLPCGRCIGCRLQRSKQWAIRCVHEASLYEENCFLTLTYSDEHLPFDESINVKHIQKFIKRLRKKYPGKTIRYFHCGEYGEDNRRPHYHICLFNFDFHHKDLWSDRNDIKLYTSEELQSLWPYGHSTIGELTFDSAAYVARYITKKINGEQAEEHYQHVTRYGELVQLQPEYITMSRRPGIASGWYDKYKTDVYPHDYVIHRGLKLKPPKFYDNLYDIDHPFSFDEIKEKRVNDGYQFSQDTTPERLHVREKIKQLKKIPRSYECK